MLARNRYKLFLLTIVLALGGAACQQGTNAPANTTANISGNANVPPPVNTNDSATVNVAPGLEVREPERYQARFTLMAQTSGGERAQAIPELTADVARNGADRRIAFRTPSGEEIVYLDRADKRFIILPRRNQYAELTPQSTGFELPRTMTPAQLVQYLQRQRGYERVGEEQLNGRAVIKYRYATQSNTNTQAGSVRNETFVYVDRETGLPLRSELNVEASGNVQGANALRAVAEIRELQTDAPDSLFVEPTNMNRIAPEQLRQQVDAVMQVATAIIGRMLSEAGGAQREGGQPVTVPQVSPAPSASPTTTARP